MFSHLAEKTGWKTCFIYLFSGTGMPGKRGEILRQCASICKPENIIIAAGALLNLQEIRNTSS